MNKTISNNIMACIAIFIAAVLLLLSCNTNNSSRNDKTAVDSFIKNEVLTKITFQEIPAKYANLNKNAINCFMKLKEGLNFLNNNKFKQAWDTWDECISNDVYINYLPETYLIIGKALGEQDGKTSLHLLQKACEIARAKNNKALEYCCLNEMIHVLVSHADDGELNQLIDKLAKQYSLEAHEILTNNVSSFNERNASNSIYRIASESLYWLGEDSLANEYHKHLLAKTNTYTNPELTQSYANIILGIKTFINRNYDSSENYFKSAINAIGDATSFLNYDLELPYAYIASIYINQKKYTQAVDYMERSLKTLQKEFYNNINEPLKLIPPEKISVNENTYNVILCFLRLQYYYNRAIQEGETQFNLNHVIEISVYTNQLIKLWFLNAADEQTLINASKLIKTSNGFVVDIMWKHKCKFDNLEDDVFKLQTEASSFYLNYLMTLRNNKNNEPNYQIIKELTVELANAELESIHLNNIFINKRLKLLKLKTELWKKEQSALNNLIYNEFTPGKLQKEDAVLKYFKSNTNLYLSYYTHNKKGVIQLEKVRLNEKIKQFKREVKSEVNSNELQQFFYNMLIKPIENELHGITHLTILTDEVLEGITFEALQNNEKQYLINRFAITHKYSAKNIGDKQLPQIENILAFAPGFIDKNLFSEQHVTRSVIESSSFININEMGMSLAPIHRSIDEVNDIGNLFEKKALANNIYTSDNATKNDLIKNLANKSIIHIATHGISNNEYESGLFFTMNNNDNGFLSLQELYQLNINADLVVLSACKTGVGEIKKGEGILALPRGFIFAGAKNVIASLWKVHDEKTKDLMLAFYKHLLDDKVGYAEALRLAKLECIEKGFLPVDWAGFVLIGN